MTYNEEQLRFFAKYAYNSMYYSNYHHTAIWNIRRVVNDWFEGLALVKSMLTKTDVLKSILFEDETLLGGLEECLKAKKEFEKETIQDFMDAFKEGYDLFKGKGEIK